MSQFPQSVVIPSKREGTRLVLRASEGSYAALEVTQEEDETPTSDE